MNSTDFPVAMAGLMAGLGSGHVIESFLLNVVDDVAYRSEAKTTR
jgi:hypothetical protein